ncbi:MAG: hypothetical protein AAF623_14980 [Planctomycetota bacterium]
MESKQRFTRTLLLATIIVGGIWVLLNKDQIQNPADLIEVAVSQIGSTSQHVVTAIQGNGRVGSVTGNGLGPSGEMGEMGAGNAIRPNRRVSSATIDQAGFKTNIGQQYVTNVIRIASFNVQPNAISQSPFSQNLTAEICRGFDAIALQNISTSDSAWLPNLVARMNELETMGAQRPGQKATKNIPNYRFVSDQAYNNSKDTIAAIIYNQTTLEMDESRWYTVADPEGILNRSPIVGWFRTRGPDSSRAFTFSLVNLSLHPSRPEQELAHLGDLFRAIRNDGRGEDDVLIVGDFNTGDRGLKTVSQRHGLTWVVSNRSTTTRNQAQSDNLVFSLIASEVFTGS